MIHKKLKTSWTLWGSVTIALFVLLGFVIPERGESYWQMWGIFLAGGWNCAWGEFVGALAFFTFFFAVPSIVIGWVLQAIVVATVAGIQLVFTRRKEGEEREERRKG